MISPVPSVSHACATAFLRLPVACGVVVDSLIINNVRLLDLESFRVLGSVWVLRATVDAEFFHDSVTQLVVWDHSTDCFLNEEFWLTSADGLRSLNFLVTDVSGVVSVNFLCLFVSREHNTLSVYNDDVVTCVNVWCEDRLMFATEEHCCFASYLSEDLVCCIDDVPLAFYVLCFCGECFHFTKFLIPLIFP